MRRRTAFVPASLMRAIVAACLGLLVAVGSAAADAVPDVLTPGERAWLASRPPVVLGAPDDWGVVARQDGSGRLSGPMIDYLDLINQKLGTDFRVEAGPWHEIVSKAEAGELDGLTVTAPLEERKKHFLFTDAFNESPDFIYLRTDDLLKKGAPVDLSGLHGKRVGHLKGNLRVSRALAAHPQITPVPLPSYATLAQNLLRGELDAVVASYALEYWRASNGVVGLAITRILHELDARLVMSINKNEPELVGILNKGIAAISRDELETIHRRWFGADYADRLAAVRVRLDADERAWLADHPVVRVGVDPRWAPVEFTDEAGVAKGISLAYLERLGKMLGVRFEVSSDRSWTDAQRALEERRIDLLPALAPTPSRERHIGFTNPYLSFPAAIFSAAGVAYLGGPEALAGKTVAVVRDEAVEPWLRANWPDLKLLPVADTREALRAVAQGRAFAFIGNLVTTSYYIGESGLTQIKVAGDAPFVYRLSMGVRGDWPVLAGILQKGLDAIPPSQRDAIYREWISIQYQHSVDYSTLRWLAAAAGAILLLIFGERTLALRRANDRLKQLAREISLVEERQRQRLASELHDSPMQKLALAQMHIGAAAKRLPPDSDERLATGIELMRESLGELRTLQFELSPPLLHQEGLGPALRWLASNASERLGLRFSFSESGTLAPMDATLAVVLYQCTRELVYNVAKHAGASEARIELSGGDVDVVVAVSDNGEGAPEINGARARSRDGGYGLFAVRERLALFGGELSIASSASGTRAVMRVPVRVAATRRDDESGPREKARVLATR